VNRHQSDKLEPPPGRTGAKQRHKSDKTLESSKIMQQFI
jgi:hypothetical protein